MIVFLCVKSRKGLIILNPICTVIKWVLQFIPPWGIIMVMKPVLKNKLLKRLKIIEGQIRGLQNMVHEGTYCVDIITQASAVKKAIGSFEDAMLQNHLETHVVEQMKSGKHAKAVTEVMKVYKLSQKDS